MDGTYHITTTLHTFILTISEYERIYTIRFGDPLNPSGPCIEMTYDANKPSILKLDNLEYRSSCANDDTLERGAGTIHMIQCALKHTLDLFPKIKRVVLHDVATIERHGRPLLLAYMYLACHGDTWYAKHFKAKPINHAIKDGLHATKQLLRSRPTKNRLSNFKEATIHPSWHTYFMTKKENCKFFLDHLQDIKTLIPIPLIYSEWYISKRYIQAYDINITRVTKIKRGGADLWHLTSYHQVA
jgi:hypothetical protein